MTNEQTIDEIMVQAGNHASAWSDSQKIEIGYRGTAYAYLAEEKASLRHAITAALASKDAEIAELLDEVQKCRLIALHLDAMHPDAPGSFAGTPSERISRAIERLKAQLAEPEPAAWRIQQGASVYIISNAEFVRSSFDAAAMTPLYARVTA